ncbi:MAG: response regulator transcription factor [Solirubrobacterales bacterium]
MSERDESISVLIVDDHPLVRERIAQLIQEDQRLALAGEASDGEEALEKIRAQPPDVIVLDVFMPGMNGVQVLATVREEMSEAKALVLTAGPTAELYDMLQQRPDALLYKHQACDQICEEILAVWREDEYSLGRAILAHAMLVACARPILNDRELEALGHLADGLLVQEAAMRLGISRRTAEGHLRLAREKLNVTTNTAAVARAYEVGHLRARPWA